MIIANVIETNQDILSGVPVFVGTRVPVATLFEHLEDGISISDFLTDFPSVSQEQVVKVLHLASLSFKNQEYI